MLCYWYGYVVLFYNDSVYNVYNGYNDSVLCIEFVTYILLKVIYSVFTLALFVYTVYNGGGKS